MTSHPQIQQRFSNVWFKGNKPLMKTGWQILDKKIIKTAIILYCQQHFWQAADTPFGSGHLAELIGQAGLMEACNEILQGAQVNLPPALPTKEFGLVLSMLAIPTWRGKTQLKLRSWWRSTLRGIKKWRKATATYPSGCHLGLYKAAMDVEAAARGLCKMLNVVVCTGLVPSQWCRAISVLLEKDPPGHPNINCWRIIHCNIQRGPIGLGQKEPYRVRVIYWI